MIPPRNATPSSAEGVLAWANTRHDARPRRRRASLPHDMPLHTATGGVARAAAALGRAKGLDIEPFLRRANLVRRTLDDPQTRIPVVQQVAFVNALAQALKDDQLGFHLAQAVDLREAGLIYYVAASSDDVARSLENLERYCRIANESVVLTVRAGDSLRVELAYSGLARHSDRHQIEFLIALVVRMYRELTAAPLRVVEAGFAHQRVRGLQPYRRFFGCAVQFGATADFVAFHRDVGSVALQKRDDYLNHILIGMCEERLARRRSISPPWRTKTQNILGPLLPHGTASLKNVAKVLGVSPRTLTRRLAGEGTTFVAVLDSMRRELALVYIRDHHLPLGHIAWLLGFSEQSAFSHAFRRWTGKAPRSARAERGSPAPM